MDENLGVTEQDLSEEDILKGRVFDDIQDVIRRHLGKGEGGKEIYPEEFSTMLEVIGYIVAEYLGQLFPEAQVEQAAFFAEVFSTRLAQINEQHEAHQEGEAMRLAAARAVGNA